MKKQRRNLFHVIGALRGGEMDEFLAGFTEGAGVESGRIDWQEISSGDLLWGPGPFPWDGNQIGTDPAANRLHDPPLWRMAEITCVLLLLLRAAKKKLKLFSVCVILSWLVIELLGYSTESEVGGGTKVDWVHSGQCALGIKYANVMGLHNKFCWLLKICFYWLTRSILF